MITLLRFTATTALALSLLGAVSFGQHYNQTNLVSSEPGVAPVTDATLINAWGMSRATGSPGGSLITGRASPCSTTAPDPNRGSS